MFIVSVCLFNVPNVISPTSPRRRVVLPLSVSTITTQGAAQRVNINLVRIKVLINREPSKLHSSRGEYTV